MAQRVAFCAQRRAAKAILIQEVSEIIALFIFAICFTKNNTNKEKLIINRLAAAAAAEQN